MQLRQQAVRLGCCRRLRRQRRLRRLVCLHLLLLLLGQALEGAGPEGAPLSHPWCLQLLPRRHHLPQQQVQPKQQQQHPKPAPRSAKVCQQQQQSLLPLLLRL
jgi:hypothetical protein